MSEQQYHHEVMAELEMIQNQLEERNQLFPMSGEIVEFAASHESNLTKESKDESIS